jgi:hypothetical protein
MLLAVTILAAVAGVLACISMIPQASTYPCLSVACLLLAVALFLMGGH